MQTAQLAETMGKKNVDYIQKRVDFLLQCQLCYTNWRPGTEKLLSVVATSSTHLQACHNQSNRDPTTILSQEPLQTSHSAKYWYRGTSKKKAMFSYFNFKKVPDNTRIR